MTCKNICHRIPNVKNYRGGRKKPNEKVCIQCEIQFPHDGLWCPCCGFRVRNRPRYSGRKKYDGVRY